MLLLLAGIPSRRLFTPIYLTGLLSTFLILSFNGCFVDVLHLCLNYSFYASVRLVDKINKSVGQDPESRFQIGVLDIYGFECFKNNRLAMIHGTN